MNAERLERDGKQKQKSFGNEKKENRVNKNIVFGGKVYTWLVFITSTYFTVL